MITITNEQTNIAIDTDQLQRDAQTVLSHLDYADFDLGILLTTNKRMQDYNKKHRGKDKPTDILSFPYHDTLQAGQRIVVQADEDKNLGDIILAPDYIKDDLPRWDMDFKQRLRVLLIHGICHLLGYDHIEDKEYEVMNELEQKLFAVLDA